jgi:hypothetical protein
MRLPAFSQTARSPFEKIAISRGLLKDASVLKPSTDDAAPEPASVVTTRDGEIRRMRWFNLSATAMLPSARTVAAIGVLNLAAVPTPLAKVAVPPPAKVETDPIGVTTRIR